MNDILYRIQLIAAAKNVAVKKVAYVPLLTTFSDFSSSPASVLPVVANTLYFISKFIVQANGAQLNTCAFTLLPITPQSDAGEAFVIINPSANGNMFVYENVYCDSMIWTIGTWSGVLYVTGDIYKVTYEA